MKKKIYAVVGQTATGKTALAAALARKIGGEVVSADSMQVYRGMDIGTAKPKMDERRGAAHYMVDIVRPDEDYSVALYQRQALACIHAVQGRGGVPVIAGGTGLYVNALTYKLKFSGAADRKLRESLGRLDHDALHAMLRRLDAESAARIHPNNRRRMIRAIEIAKDGGGTPYDFNCPDDTFEWRMTGLGMEREDLYRRVERRVDDMMADGLAAEVETLYRRYGKDPVAMQGIGYKEFIPYLEGMIPLDEAVRSVKRHTRRFAKRQQTWFKRDERIKWIDPASYADTDILADAILKGF